MAYDAQSLQSFYGLKEDGSLDPAAGLVPLTSSLIPPLVAQAFGLPSLGSAAPAPPPQPQHHQSAYGALMNPALMGAFGFGGAQYAAAVQQQQSQQLASMPLGYLQALAAASQQQQQQQQQLQQQQQQHTAAALLHAHTAALAASARSAPATSSAMSQPLMSADTSSRRGCEPERAATTSGTTNSSVPKSQHSYASSACTMPYQNPLHSLYAAAALAQQQAAYAPSPANCYAAALGPYAASHLHSAYYGRPDANAAAAAAAAVAAASGVYGYQHIPVAGPYGTSFHPGYGPPPLDYSALLAAYRPVAAPSSLPAPSNAPQQSQSLGEDDTADDGSTRAIKRPRLVWTTQLHKKFESAVGKLGVDKAVPKNIMQEMNIDGLTRENVASHLQKYRMLRRKDATCSEGRDSDTRTAGSKRSDPEQPGPAAPSAPEPAAARAASPPSEGGGSPTAPTPIAASGVAIIA